MLVSFLDTQYELNDDGILVNVPACCDECMQGQRGELSYNYGQGHFACSVVGKDLLSAHQLGLIDTVYEKEGWAFILTERGWMEFLSEKEYIERFHSQQELEGFAHVLESLIEYNEAKSSFVPNYLLIFKHIRKMLEDK